MADDTPDIAYRAGMSDRPIMLGLILCIRALAGHLARARTTARVEFTA